MTSPTPAPDDVCVCGRNYSQHGPLEDFIPVSIFDTVPDPSPSLSLVDVIGYITNLEQDKAMLIAERDQLREQLAEAERISEGRLKVLNEKADALANGGRVAELEKVEYDALISVLKAMDYEIANA